jgi:hypothetical protein
VLVPVVKARTHGLPVGQATLAVEPAAQLRDETPLVASTR